MRRHLYPVSLALGLGFAACKSRNPDAAGLLSEPSAYSGPELAKGGDWLVTCTSGEAGSDGSRPSYTLSVQGAASPTDEGQDILVSASKTLAGHSDPLAEQEPGHGAIGPTTPVFLGFSSGVLTANPNASVQPALGTTHSGVLTLAKDPAAEGLSVNCSVVKTNAAAAVKDSPK